MLASLFTRLTLIRRENVAACKIQQLWKTYRQKKTVATEEVGSLIIDETSHLIPSQETFSHVGATAIADDALQERQMQNLNQISTAESNLEISFEANEGCHINKRCSFLVNEKKDGTVENLSLMEDDFKETGDNLCMIDQPDTMEPSNGENRREDVPVNAARFIQQWYRNLCLLRKDRSKFVEIRLSVSVIQKYWKQYLRRKNYRQLVITIQSACRAFMIRKDLFSNSKTATVLLKVHNRLNKRSCTLNITSLATGLEEFIGAKISSNVPADLVIGRVPGYNGLLVSCGESVASGVIDGNADRCNVSSDRVIGGLKYFNYQWNRLEPFIRNYAAAFISHYLRCSIKALNLRREFITRRAACIVLQKSITKWLIVRRRQKKEQEEKILLLEQQQRRKQEENELLEKQQLQQREYEQHVNESKAALKIQHFWRSAILVRKCRQNFFSKRSAAVQLQAFIRGGLAAQRYRRTRSAADTICRWYRNLSHMRKTRAKYLSIKFFIITLQSNIRGYLQRNHLLLQIRSAVIVQANYRSYLQKQKYIAWKSACVRIQLWWKPKYQKMVAEKELARKSALEESAIVFTQSLIRGAIARNQFEKRRAINKTVKDAFVQIRSAIIIQRAFRKVRGKLLVWYYRNKLHNSAIKIQALWRGYCLRRDLGYFIENVIIVQRAFRKYYYCKSPIEEFKRCRNAAIMIQKTYRGYMTRKTSTVALLRKAVNTIGMFYIKYREKHFRRKLAEAASTKIQVSFVLVT